jgi:hypothetical protein
MANNMNAIVNSWWMYLLGIIVVLFVLGISVFFIIKAFKDAKELNMDTKMLKKVIFNSAIFTILPSIAILIGIVALSGQIGIPLPWIRLSVIGALQYEGTAVQSVLNGNQLADPSTFITIALVMTLGIISGPLFCLFGFELYDKKVLSKARTPKEEIPAEVVVEESKPKNEKPKKDLGSLLFSAVFIALVSAFMADDIKVLLYPKGGEYVVYQPTPYVPTVVIVVTILSMWIFDILEKKCKQKWLASFSLGFSMIIGMATAAIIEWMVR